MREAIDAMDIMDEAEVEHTLAKQLVEELKAMQPDDPLYDAKFTVLGEYVKHRIEDEQKEMFPKVKKAKMHLGSLGGADGGTQTRAARRGGRATAKR